MSSLCAAKANIAPLRAPSVWHSSMRSVPTFAAAPPAGHAMPPAQHAQVAQAPAPSLPLQSSCAISRATRRPHMTSYLRQARTSGFVAGVGTAAALYAYSKREIQGSTEELAEQLPGAAPRVTAPAAEEQAPEPMLGGGVRVWAVRQWNEGVDAVFKPVVEALARRGL